MLWLRAAPQRRACAMPLGHRLSVGEHAAFGEPVSGMSPGGSSCQSPAR
jgi:hypothetical protein